MTISPEALLDRRGPTYLALAERLAEEIAAGRLRPGDRLPPQRDLAFRLRVTVGTVGRAYDLLAQRGLVRGEVGRGTYVLAPLATASLGEPLAADPTASDAEGLIDLTANFPAPIAAQAELGRLLPSGADAAELWAELARYPEIAGAARHRAAAAAWLKRLGVPAEPERVVLTNGAEGGLAVSLLALARPGDAVLAEALCYSGLRGLAARLGQRLEPVAVDEAGIVPEAVAGAARHTGARLLVVSPNLHNPTAALTPLPRREALVRVAREADLLLVEDDVYGPLVAERPPALAELAPERTVHISSLSKFLAPGLRLGFLHGPPALVQAVTATQRELSLGHTPLAAELFARAEADGLLEAAVRQQQEEMAARQRLAAGTLAGLEVASQPTALHLWLALPERWTSVEAALALARRGILVAPAERFFLGRGATPRAVRLSLSAPRSRAELQRALERVAAVLASPGTESGAAGLV